jgi:hypothetical protein
VRNDVDWLLRLELPAGKSRLDAPSEHIGTGFNSRGRIHGRSDDRSLKAFSQKRRHPRKIIDWEKRDIQVAEAKDTVHKYDIHSFSSFESCDLGSTLSGFELSVFEFAPRFAEKWLLLKNGLSVQNCTVSLESRMPH